MANIGQRVDARPISIKHLEFQMSQLSSTVNSRQPGTFPSNTVQNQKNDGHCMAITTQRGKTNINPPTPSGVEDEVRKEN